jgi:hypothetical protein
MQRRVSSAGSKNTIHQVPFSSGGSLSTSAPSQSQETTVSYQALGSLEKPELVQFSTVPMNQDTESTGHVVARLSVSIAPEDPSFVGEKDIDPS